jgi:uncharacterized protein YecE (DUF72 family)
LEVRHPSFACSGFHDLARAHGAAIIYADSTEFPQINEPTADFTYARLMSTHENLVDGLPPKELLAAVKQARTWAKRGDAFIYFVAGAKIRNPAAARAFIAELDRKAS